MLVELKDRLTQAIRDMKNATVVDESVVNECLNEITRALLRGDVPFHLVKELVNNVKKSANLNNLPSGINKRKILEESIFSELCNMLNPGKPSFTPRKGETSVVMFVGLQGTGKTTTCAKYAYYHQKKGWKPALICADTFRDGALDQLKQDAVKVEIPYYGSSTESDPTEVALEGLKRFKNENRDLIIIDTSGRHKQEVALLEEMRQLYEATKPDLVVFLIDSSIGQAAFDQARAFKQSVSVGGVIVTKFDGHAKGGGAISAVAATKCPVIFIENGEQLDKFEAFDAKAFVCRLLGKHHPAELVDRFRDSVSLDEQADLCQMFTDGENFTFKKYQAVVKHNYKMGPLLLSQVRDLQPNVQENVKPEQMKKYLIMMDSLTSEELNSSNPKIMKESRIRRIAQGSGCHVGDVMKMLEHYKQLANMCTRRKMDNMTRMISRGRMPSGAGMSGDLMNMFRQLSSSAGMARMLSEAI
ncbi:signal recognition particle subunit SRP54 2 [Coffea arabica]|uniref:signal-recognition-particle GTPase n=1 Tax=Coffea arabica TaxID=13443 RepID=A0A6P6TMC6_COFAR